MRPKLKVWVVFRGGTKLGDGRADLFRVIAEEGSLKRAVERTGMSYRAAWGYVRELERAAGFRFLEPAGSGRAAGVCLTRKAKTFLRAYGCFRSGLDRVVESRFRKAFGIGVRRPGRERSPGTPPLR